MMKYRVNCYKSIFTPIRPIDFSPHFEFSKNVQSWYFTRNWSLTWFIYQITFSATLISDLSENGEYAHQKNVAKYMRSGVRTFQFPKL